MAGRIFISYRRDDAAGDAGRLADHLYARFGRDRVFLDIDTIDPGTDFVRVLHASLGETAAVLVVIGPRWLTLTGETGVRRLDDPHDFVRMEVAAALGRDVLVVPVLVQGARMPREGDLPEALAGLVTRQAFALDHSEFHQDAERLCDRLARLVDGAKPRWLTAVRRWWPAAAAVLVIGVLAAYLGLRGPDGAGAGSSTSVLDADTTPADTTPVAPEPASNAPPPDAGPVATTRPPGPAVSTVPSGGAPSSTAGQRVREAEALVAEAALQRRRGQFTESLTTLGRARALAPDSASIRDAEEAAAMDWVRNVRVTGDTSTFTDAIKPAMTVIDAAIPGATGPRRADLLAHSGWATFLLWRDGNRRLDPAEWYREALAIESANPYANAMLAHWTLFRGDDVAQAAKLFETALSSGRAGDAVRALQWAAYGNSSTSEANAELVRLADAMRRDGQKLRAEQASRLWGPYYSLLPAWRDRDRQVFLQALPPDEHIQTLAWAFDEYIAADTSREPIRRYWVSVLHARAGRTARAVAELKAQAAELSTSPGTLQDAVQATLKRVQAAGNRPGR